MKVVWYEAMKGKHEGRLIGTLESHDEETWRPFDFGRDS